MIFNHDQQETEIPTNLAEWAGEFCEEKTGQRWNWGRGAFYVNLKKLLYCLLKIMSNCLGTFPTQQQHFEDLPESLKHSSSPSILCSFSFSSSSRPHHPLPHHHRRHSHPSSQLPQHPCELSIFGFSPPCFFKCLFNRSEKKQGTYLFSSNLAKTAFSRSSSFSAFSKTLTDFSKTF